MHHLVKLFVLAGLALTILGNVVMDINLATAQGYGFTITTAEEDSNFGKLVKNAGDVNGDGVMDFVIRATAADTAYIIFGRRNGNVDLNVTSNLTNNGFKISGAIIFDISNAGDINGDGIDDLIFSLPYFSAFGRYTAGVVHVIFGRRTGITDIIISHGLIDNALGFSIFGSAENELLGTSISSAGDVNADGQIDIVIGCGAVTYVIFGGGNRTNTNIDLANGLNNTLGFKIFGPSANLGSSVSGVGDVNGDKIDDIIVGDSGMDSPSGVAIAGRAHVIFGRKSGSGDIDLTNGLNGNLGFTIFASQEFGNFGNSVSGADMNGDGLNDLIIGAPGSSPVGRPFGGMAYVIFGRNGSNNDIDLESGLSNTTGFVIYGATGGGTLGVSVSGAGDVNGDGVDDAIIGAPTESNSAGSVYVIFGKRDNISNIDLLELKRDSGFRILGGIAYREVGNSVSSIGDLDDDGISDIIIGAPRTNQVYVIFPKPCSTGCLNCSGNGATCNVCDTALGYLKLYNNLCYKSCPNDTYSSSGDGCAPCSQDCQTCSGSATYCTSCNPATGLAKLYNGTCYASCPLRTYEVSGSSCASCSSQCLTCLSNESYCTSCDANSGLPKLFNGRCNTSCPTGTFSNSENVCSACSLVGCLSCSNDGTTCTLCDSPSGYTINYNGKCYKNCPAGTYANTGNGCAACGMGCLACSGSGSSCTLCDLASGYLHLINGTCYKDNPNIDPLPSPKPDPSSCNSKCPNCLDYYFPEEVTCNPQCPYPYQIEQDSQQCSLLLGPIEVEKAQTWSDALNIATKVTRISGTIAVPWTAFDPWFFTFLSSTELLYYVRYMDVGFSAQAQKAFLAKDDAVISLNTELDGANSYHSLPLKFKQYSVPPTFIVNFWQPTLTFVVIGLIILFSLALQHFLANYQMLSSIFHIIYETLKWNYLLMTFISYYPALVLYTSIEFRSLHADSGLEVFSLILCIFMNFVALGMPLQLFRMIRAYNNQRAQSNTTNDAAAAQNSNKTWNSLRAFLVPFNTSLSQQVFMPIYIIKTYLFSFVFAHLFEHALVQGILLTILSLNMLTYLIIKRPFRQIINQVEFLIMESVFLLVSICALILAGLDQANKEASEARKGLSEAILYSVLIFTWAGEACLVVKVIYGIRTLYNQRKAYKQKERKPKKDLYLQIQHTRDGNAYANTRNTLGISSTNREPKTINSIESSPTLSLQAKKIQTQTNLPISTGNLQAIPSAEFSHLLSPTLRSPDNNDKFSPVRSPSREGRFDKEIDEIPEQEL